MRQLKLKYRISLILVQLLLMAPILLQAQTGVIKIGVLIPDSSHMDLVHACEMALAGPNSQQSGSGLQYQLVVRSAEGPWGTGSKASVDLIYEDSIVALLSALDGRNAHLAEQVVAKTQVACIEARATDPTLTQAYVPWYLRCVPSDDQQAELILKKIEAPGGGKTAIICTGEYDTRMTAHSFTKILAGSGSAGPVILNLSKGNISARELADQIREKEVHNLILSVNLPLVWDLISLLRKDMPDLNIFGSYAFAADVPYGEGKWQKYEGLYLLTSALPLSEDAKTFETSFIERYGYQPGIEAAYVHDGMKLILAALQLTPRDREDVRNRLINMDYKGGLTGRISFDELGNRKDAAQVVKIENGKARVID